MNGSVFPRFRPIVCLYVRPLRLTPMAHATLYPPCCGFVVFAGDVNGAAEYNFDVVRDRESPCVVCALGDPRVTTPQRDCDTRQERPSPTD
jgi:hypothetical protein